MEGLVTAFEDVDGTVVPERVWQRIENGAGELLPNSNPDFGVTDSTYWLSIPVHRMTLDPNQEWVLEVAFARLRDVRYFAIASGGEVLDRHELLVTTPLRERPVYGRTYAFPLREVSQVHSILIRVESDVPMQVPLILQSRVQSESSRIQRDFALGIYFGLALIMVLYNLTIFAFTRETMYLMYSALVASFAVLIFLSKGFGYYVFPDSWAQYYVVVVLAGTIGPAMFIVAFVYLFFDFGNRDRVSAVVLYGLMCLMLTRLVLFAWLGNEARSVSGSVLGAFFVICLLGITARQMMLKQPGARLLFVAWSAFLGGVLVFYFNRLGILPRNNMTEHAMLIGSSIEITMLSFAIPHRLRELRLERDKVMQNLASVTGDLARETQKREALAGQVSELNRDIDGSKLELESLRGELGASENQLIQAEKMASVGQLVASVTHDIANPTTHILVSQSALTSKIEDLLNAQPGSVTEEKLRKELNSVLRYADFIRSGASTIADIHRSFAYYSRSDTKMRASVDIEKVLKDAMTILTTRVQPHVLNTIFLECPRIACRPSEICQMVANLVSNAADVLSGIGVEANGADTDSQSGRISLRVSPAQEHGADGVAIEVHDSGPGIPEEQRHNIFKPFITSKEAGEGTGLGLAITQRIVERHSGRIEVTDSEEFGGALFRVWIPVEQSDDDYESEPAVQV